MTDFGNLRLSSPPPLMEPADNGADDAGAHNLAAGGEMLVAPSEKE